MLDSINRQEMVQLLESKGGPHLSILLTAPLKPNEAKNDAIRLKNVLRDSRDTLTEYWLTAREVDALLSPLEELCIDSRVLADRRQGMAIFRSADIFKVYAVDQLLHDQLSIARDFHVRQVVPLAEDAVFYLLTLSQNRVALFDVTDSTITEVDVPGLPESFALESQSVTADRGAQVHSGGRAGTDKQSAVFHGQGGHQETEKTELSEYLRRVDQAVGSMLSERDGHLILAGVEELTTTFHAVSDFPRLCESTIAGNVDHMNTADLHEKALSLIADQRDQRRAVVAQAVREQRDNPAATDPERILCAAHQGSVDTLFFDRGAEIYGSFYPDTKTMKETRQPPSGDPGDANHDLIELAVAETLRRRGIVYPVATADMPVTAKMAALLRY